MKTLLKSSFAAGCLVALLAWAGCTNESPETPSPAEPDASVETAPTPRRAVATLMSLGRSGVSGRVTFTQVDGGVQVSAVINRLQPGLHGFHLHEIGQCQDEGAAAGGHYNPNGSPHGAPDASAGQRHVGDLGNLEASASGMAKYSRVDNVMTFDGPNSILGRAVIIHAGADDLTSQPSGNAGARVACGIIRAEN